MFREQPNMVGCIRNKDGQITYVGTSQNYPWISINKTQFAADYHERKAMWLGDDLIAYDRHIQTKINADDLKIRIFLAEIYCILKNDDSEPK